MDITHIIEVLVSMFIFSVVSSVWVGKGRIRDYAKGFWANKSNLREIISTIKNMLKEILS